jgi:hypothetical protein
MYPVSSLLRANAASAATLLAVLAGFGGALAQSETPSAPVPASALESCDAHWARRAEGAEGGRARSHEIDAAVEACKKAAADAKDALEPRWKLMRALYYKGEYTTDDVERKKTIFDEGKKVGEEALDVARRLGSRSTGRPMEKAGPLELAPALKANRDAVASFLWAAADWGKWALAFGKSAAVKQGAAAKIRDYSTAVIRMDPAFEDAGGYRVLGRLHHQTPSVPFFTGWASRSEALASLEKAAHVAPRNFNNRLYLADALWDYEKPRRGEARAMLEALLKDAPSAESPVEDRKAQEEAQALLAQWKH